MCDPLTGGLLLGAAVGVGAAASQRRGGGAAAAPAGLTPEEEQAQAAAQATQAANAKIAERQRRRRSQGSLLATLGVPDDQLGAKITPDGYTNLVGQPAPMGYVTAGRASAANVLGGGGGGNGAGGGGAYRPARY